MNDRKDTTNDRLNRKIAQMRYRTYAYVGITVLFVGLLMAFVILDARKPAHDTFVIGVAGQSFPLMTDEGTRVLTRFTIETSDGPIVRDIHWGSRSAFPEVGSTLCLRIAVQRISGYTRNAVVPNTFCEGLSPTPSVD